MSKRAWVLFAAISLIWGVPYLFIKVAVDGGVSPFFLAWARVLMAAVILLAAAPRPTRDLLVSGPRRWIAAYAVLEITLPFPLIAAGERHLASSVAAIVIATVPLLIAMLALRFDRSERADADADDRDAHRPRRRDRPGGDRPDRPAGGAARGRSGDGGGGWLCRRPDDPEAPPFAVRSAGDDGREPADGRRS